MNVLRAACLVRDFEFDSLMELICFINSLNRRGVEWVELGRYIRCDGSVTVRLLTSYRDVDLLLL